MTTLYTLNKRINNLLPKVAEKYNLEIEIKPTDYFYYELFSPYTEEIVGVGYRHFDEYHLKIPVWGVQNSSSLGGYTISEIKAPQIRQILLALKNVLDKNPEHIQWQIKNDSFADVRQSISYNTIEVRKLIAFIEFRSEEAPIIKQSDALCAKWLDGLNPLIDRNEESVLSEFAGVLEELLN